MHLYPEVTSSISKLWQMGKWCNEVPLNELSPMWADWENVLERHFYVDKVAHTKAGWYILPKRWIVVDKKECAEGHPVYFSKHVSRTETHLTSTLNTCLERQVSGQNGRDHSHS